MRLSLRFVIPLLIALAAFAYVSVPLADALMLRWFVRDLDIRSSLIASTVQEPLSALVPTRSAPRISAFFNRMLQDERLYGVGTLPRRHVRADRDAQFPAARSTARRWGDMPSPDDGKRVLQTPRGPLHVAARPRRPRVPAGRAAGARPRHELRRAPQRGDAPLPVLFLRRAERRDRAHHRRDRPAFVARLGAGPACAAARRRHPAPVHARRPPRNCGRSRAICAS